MNLSFVCCREATEETASLSRANIKEPSIVKYRAKVQETTPAAMKEQTKEGRKKREIHLLHLPLLSDLTRARASIKRAARISHPPRINT